jgi:hypothetical protein
LLGALRVGATGFSAICDKGDTAHELVHKERRGEPTEEARQCAFGQTNGVARVGHYC